MKTKLLSLPITNAFSVFLYFTLYYYCVYLIYVCKIYIEILFSALRRPSSNYHYKDFTLVACFVKYSSNTEIFTHDKFQGYVRKLRDYSDG